MTKKHWMKWYIVHSYQILEQDHKEKIKGKIKEKRYTKYSANNTSRNGPLTAADVSPFDMLSGKKGKKRKKRDQETSLELFTCIIKAKRNINEIKGKMGVKIYLWQKKLKRRAVTLEHLATIDPLQLV